MNVEAIRVQGLEDGRAARARCVALGQSDAGVIPSVDPALWPADVAAAYRAGFWEGARPACGGECASVSGALGCACMPPF